MDLRQVKELMIAMGRTGTRRLRIKQEEFEIELEHEHQVDPRVVNGPVEGSVAHPHAVTVSPPRAPAPLQAPLVDGSRDGVPSGRFVTSPMVGTFYLSSGPDTAPFIRIGDRVEKDTVVCIIEAMKVMNEVKAGVEGIVREVCVENSHPVEFGTKLFNVTD